MKLLIDAGNCRVKWATKRGDALEVGDAVTIDRDSHELESALTTAWAALDRPAAVWVSCVAGRAVAEAVTAAAERAWNLRPAFIAAQARQAGVVNSYPRPAALGGDRWAALVGARAMRPGAATVVVDAGTAVTVDALDAAGVFRGGVILPGARAMVDALARRTANLGDGGLPRHPRSVLSGGGDGECGDGVRAGDDGDVGDSDSDSDTVTGDTVTTALATDTVTAMTTGAWLAVAGGIDRAIAAQLAAMKSAGDNPVTLITGGDACHLAPLLMTPTQAAPDLVLRGLAILAAAS